MISEPLEDVSLTPQTADPLHTLDAELLALKKDNKELKALLAQLPPGTTNGRVALASELRDLDLQANALRKHHDRLVQDRLSSTCKLAQLKDGLKDLHCDSQLVFAESPGSRLVKQLEQKLTAALAKHDAAQATCHTLEESAQQLREHRQTHDSQLAAVEQAVAARKAELEELLASHKAVQLAKDTAKAELALVEQQLRSARAARDAQLQQHSALVQRRQAEYQALHQGAMQRLHHWRSHLPVQPGATAGSSTAGLSRRDAMTIAPDEAATETAAAADCVTETTAASELAAETTAAACSSMPEPATVSSPETGPVDEASPSAVGATQEAAAITPEADPGKTATSKQSGTASGQETAAENAPAELDHTGTDAADAAVVAGAAASTSAAAVEAAVEAGVEAAPMGDVAVAAEVGASHSPAPTVAAPVSECECAAEGGAPRGVKQDGAADPTPELSCRQAFAAAQYATGVTDMTDLVDRFLTQDVTHFTLKELEQQSQAYLQELQKRSAALQITLEELQLGRSLLHRQAEAAIKEADAQIKLNKGQYDDVGRLLVHAKAAIQALITKLEPLFPEIAGMGVSSDGLVEAIHGCELRLVHAYEAVLAFRSKSSSKIPAIMDAVDGVSGVPPQQLGTDMKPNMSDSAAPRPEGVSSILRQPDVA
ncbi:hypothetical protein ABBQ38_008856 [Trebouxia sp. C0009 RCD-2024]